MNFPSIEYKDLLDEIHIWTADLDQLSTDFDHAKYMLPEHEQEKAKRFRFETLRKRYIQGHMLLRTLIGRYLGKDFYDQEFYYNQHGKPSLEQNTQRSLLNFNLSNSENVFVCAFTKDTDIGVDVEKIHDLQDMDKIVERFFSSVENDKFRSLDEQKRKLFFFKTWVCKEALLKAMGIGLSFPLNLVNVLSNDSDNSPVFITIRDKRKKNEWTLCNRNILEGFASAFALKGKHTNYNANIFSVD